MTKASWYRWSIVIVATTMWGLPLSELSSRLGYGPLIGVLVALVGVLIGELFCFIWWLRLTTKQAEIDNENAR